MKKTTKLLLLLATILFLLSGCLFENVPEKQFEDWIVTANIDGSEIEYITNENIGTPYFVPDLQNPGQELILIDTIGQLELMNLDGSNRRVINDSLGSIHSFSKDKTKMLLDKDGEIYISNVDGTELQNLTNSPEIFERYPSFDSECKNIVYSAKKDINDSKIIVKNLENGNERVIYEECYPDSANDFFYLKHTMFYNDSKVSYIYDFGSNNTEQSKQILQTIDLATMNIIKEIHHFWFYGATPFSSDENYLTVYGWVYDINNDIIYGNRTEKIDINNNSTKITFVTSREIGGENEN